MIAGEAFFVVSVRWATSVEFASISQCKYDKFYQMVQIAFFGLPVFVMTNLLRLRPFLLIFLLALCGTNGGCDLGTYAQRAETASQGYVTPRVVAPTASSSDEDGKTDGPVVAGKWAMDATATANLVQRKVNPIIIGGPEVHRKLVEGIREGSMDFDLKADGTFTCSEDMGGLKATYKGDWKINGDQITINQTHMNGSPVKDKAVGTVNGNKMDLQTKNGGVSVPIILRRR